MRTSCDDSTSAYSAKAAVRIPCAIGRPPASLSGLSSSSGKVAPQVTGCPARQPWQWPHERISVTTTGSPGETEATPLPTRLTMPAASWP